MHNNRTVGVDVDEHRLREGRELIPKGSLCDATLTPAVAGVKLRDLCLAVVEFAVSTSSSPHFDRGVVGQSQLLAIGHCLLNLESSWIVGDHVALSYCLSRQPEDVRDVLNDRLHHVGRTDVSWTTHCSLDVGVGLDVLALHVKVGEVVYAVELVRKSKVGPERQFVGVAGVDVGSEVEGINLASCVERHLVISLRLFATTADSKVDTAIESKLHGASGLHRSHCSSTSNRNLVRETSTKTTASTASDKANTVLRAAQDA
mmetsp:Transcript_7489/g.17141  ORF Transcript_7489/g.17141 Transcript_7489/m.17141 type:complete len:260 (+) Transcript_7489:1078-1857(+)